MKIINLKQDTPEWHEYRRMRIGASDIGIILGVSSFKKTRYKLWEQKITGDRGFVSDAMKHGKEMESKAIDVFQLRHPDAKTERGIVGESEEVPYIFASFDAIVTEGDRKYVLEVKCPTSKEVFEEYKKGNFPPDYEYQIQQQMYVASTYNVKEGCLMAFYEGETASMWYEMVKQEIDEIKGAAKGFYKCLLTGEAPELSDKDRIYEQREDVEWIEAAFNCREACIASDNWKKESEKWKDKLKELSNGSNCKGHGVMVTKSIKPGTVDYKKIPQLKDVDLSIYRKEPSVVLTVRVE